MRANVTGYDTIRQKSLTWTRKLSIQLYLAHVARDETKTIKRRCPFNTVQVKITEQTRKQCLDETI